MNDNEHLDIWIKISQQIGELNAAIKSTLDKIAQHEHRLTKLEENKTTMTNTIITYLLKGLIAAIMVIGSLTGSASLIQQIVFKT